MASSTVCTSRRKARKKVENYAAEFSDISSSILEYSKVKERNGYFDLSLI